MNSNQDFTTGSIPRKMIAFMLPILGVLVLQALYGSVDLLIVGRFGTGTGISAVSTGSGIISFFTFIVAAFSMAVTILMGKLLGEKQQDKTGDLIGSGICFFAVIAAVSSILLVVFAEPLARLMKVPESAVALTVQYIRICGAGYVFVVAFNFISALFRGIGNSGLPLYFVGAAAVVNVIGDLILVGVFKMNVAGAAAATVAAQFVSVVLSLVFLWKNNTGLSFSLGKLHFGREIKEITRLGLPLVFQEILTNLIFMAMCAFINRIGLSTSAGFGVSFKIQTFVLLVSSAILQSMAAFVAQNVGAGNEERARQAMKTGILIGSIAGLATGALTFFAGSHLSRLFTDDPEIIAKSAACLRGMAADAVITSILFSLVGYFNGHGRTKFVLLQGIAQSLLVRLPLSYFMSRIPGISLEYITLAVPAASGFGLIMSILYYRRLRRNSGEAQRSFTGSSEEVPEKLGK